jgi:Ner family transcriptional regulator
MPRKRWDKHAILAEVHRRGATLTSISRRAGLCDCAARTVLHGRHWRRAEKAIADFLGEPVERLFPDRYRGTASRRQSSARRAAGKGQKISTRTNRNEAA